MPLITTIAEYRNYVALDKNMVADTLLPYRNDAELTYLRDLLGNAFYTELANAYAAASNNIADMSPAQQALMPYVQRTLTHYTLLLALPLLQTHIGEMGLRQDRSEHSDPAPRWMQEKMMMSTLRAADQHADKLLEYLEGVAASFPTWANSPANTKKSGYIVYSTTIAAKHIDINSSRRVFLKLWPKIKEIESKHVIKLIGANQYNEIVTELQAGTLSANNKKLTDLIEPIVAKRALFMQLPFMRVQLDGGGVFVYSGTDDLIKLGQLASDADIKILRHQLMDADEFGYLHDEEELNQYLLDNIDTYPLVKASGIYTSRPDPGPTWRPAPPEPDDKFFAV